ncbi:MAG: ribonuclease P protein component [Spirochaetaceae bacterium]|nr:ribonuclease P protein component [Spirochaetaceae bacterium]
MKKSLTKKQRLTVKQIKLVFKGQKKVKGAFSKLVYNENNLPFCRFAVSVGKKNGNAVMRNTLKRKARESLRQHKYYIKQGLDLVWVLYPSPLPLNFDEELLKLLNKMSLK